MTEEPEGRTIADELSTLVSQLARAAKAGWESEERKKLQSEIVEGVQAAGAQLSAAMQKAIESDTAGKLRTKAEEVAADLRESDAVGEVRKGIIGGLAVLNQELGRLLAQLEEQPQAAGPEAPAAGGPSEEQAE